MTTLFQTEDTRSYDHVRAYLCSKPVNFEPVSPFTAAQTVRSNLSQRKDTLADSLEQVYEGFFNRSEVRRKDEDSDRTPGDDRLAYGIPAVQADQQKSRHDRLGRLIEAGRSRNEAVALAVAAEAWSVGAQTIFLTRR